MPLFTANPFDQDVGESRRGSVRMAALKSVVVYSPLQAFVQALLMLIDRFEPLFLMAEDNIVEVLLSICQYFPPSKNIHRQQS